MKNSLFSQGERTIVAVVSLMVGIGTAVAFVVVSFLIGILVNPDAPGEYHGWMPLIFAEYSTVPAIAVGIVVAVRFYKSHS